jgi:AraC-like DNA-binding protein
VRPGTLFWLRPGDEGLATHDPANPLVVIFVHFSFFETSSGSANEVEPEFLPSRYIPLRDRARVEPLLARVVQLIQLPAPLSEVETTSLLRMVIAEAYRQDAANHGALNVEIDRRVVLILQQLYSHPARRLSLQDVAAAVELSPDHFSRLFRAQTGTSFRQYCLNVRLDRARQLLEETTMSVTEVAHALGYDDIFLFSRQCKAKFGLAPSRLRRGPPRPER